MEDKEVSKVFKTKRFRSKTTFRNWLRSNNYTKDASPGTGIYNKSGKRIGSAWEKEHQSGVNKGKRYMEVDLY